MSSPCRRQAFDPPRSPSAPSPSSPTMTHYGRAVCCRPFISDEKWIWPTAARTHLAPSLSGKTTMTTPHFKIRAPSHLPPSLPSSLGPCINDARTIWGSFDLPLSPLVSCQYHTHATSQYYHLLLCHATLIADVIY